MWVGTAGYSYPDWKGVFYPDDMKDSEFLRFYSGKFTCVEMDSTYYRIPGSEMFEAIVKKVPKGFRFTVKVPGTFTHQREKLEETLVPFRRAIEPLIEEGMLGCLVVQFPYSFKAAHKEHRSGVKTPVCRIQQPLRGVRGQECRDDGAPATDAKSSGGQ